MLYISYISIKLEKNNKTFVSLGTSGLRRASGSQGRMQGGSPGRLAVDAAQGTWRIATSEASVAICRPPWVSSLGCCNKSPQAEWLKTTDIYSLRVLDARSLSQNAGPAGSSSGLRESPLGAPLPRGQRTVLGPPGPVGAGLQPLPPSSCSLPSVSLCLFLLCFL